MAKTTIVNEAWRETIDGQTGEVLQLEHSEGTRTIIKQEPAYIKLYIQDVLYLRDMPAGLTGVMYALLKEATYADKGLRIYLPTGLKKELIAAVGTTKAAFDNALSKLCKGQIIRRVSTGVYELNPFFFGRGEWKDIDRIRATWDYDSIKGRTFQATVTRKDGTTETMGEPQEESDGEERTDTARVAV